MADITNEDKSRAVVVYFGQGSFPSPSPAAVSTAFGQTMGAELNAYVESLDTELFSPPVDWTAHTLTSATHEARARMREAHPELSDQAIDALGWWFSWNWR